MPLRAVILVMRSWCCAWVDHSGRRLHRLIGLTFCVKLPPVLTFAFLKGSRGPARWRPDRLHNALSDSSIWRKLETPLGTRVFGQIPKWWLGPLVRREREEKCTNFGVLSKNKTTSAATLMTMVAKWTLAIVGGSRSRQR